jgi:hypothetical protein
MAGARAGTTGSLSFWREGKKEAGSGNARAGSFAAMNTCLSVDGADGAGVNTCAAIDAGVSVDGTLAALLADGVHGAGVITCATVGAIVGNSMRHGSTSL